MDGGGVHGLSFLSSTKGTLGGGKQQRRPPLGGGASRRGLQSREGPQGGGKGREAGAGKNPLGRNPEWIISADESLFSFRLNTLNRAPSDVYLHSLRANAGGGPRRRRSPSPGWGPPGSAGPPPPWAWRPGSGFSQPQPPLEEATPALREGKREEVQHREYIPVFCLQVDLTKWGQGGPACCVPRPHTRRLWRQLPFAPLVQCYPPPMDEDTDRRRVTHTATQQQRGAPERKGQTRASSSPCQRPASGLPWQGGAHPLRVPLGKLLFRALRIS